MSVNTRLHAIALHMHTLATHTPLAKGVVPLDVAQVCHLLTTPEIHACIMLLHHTYCCIATHMWQYRAGIGLKHFLCL